MKREHSERVKDLSHTFIDMMIDVLSAMVTMGVLTDDELHDVMDHTRLHLEDGARRRQAPQN